MKKLLSILLCGVMLANFTACDGFDVDDPADAQVYVGVVAFNKTANKMPISNKLTKVKEFIRNQTNSEDFTAFCYSVSEGNKMFDESGLPEFDQIFMLNFSDGTDNYSNMLWGQEGRIVGPQEVYDACKSDLSKRVGLNSYALGFGNDAGFKTQMKKIVLGTGVYKNATSQSQLQSTFNEIAKSMISSAKNVVLKTNAGYYSDAAPKYFRFSFTSSKNVSDVIYAKMTGNPNAGFKLTVTKKGKYAQFDNPVHGQENNGKVELPLRNLKFVYNNEEITFDFKVTVSFDGSKYYEDVEEASTAEEISKRIAVVLVLDCSESMGDSFSSMQEAAIGLIETLTGMNSGSSSSGGTSGSHSGNATGGETFEIAEAVDLGLPSGLLWASWNIGATKAEEYGDYYAWGETDIKIFYDWGRYTWCYEGDENSLTKYCTKGQYGNGTFVDNKTTLDLEDDVANMQWGNDWRIPTNTEWKELIDKCTWTWTKLNGISGYNIQGTNGKSIFLPAAGYRELTLYDNGYDCNYWSSSLDKNDPRGAYRFHNTMDSRARYCGRSIRPVCTMQ